MDRKSGNRGIIVTGGRLDADQIAVGKGAQANKYIAARSQPLPDAELQKIWQVLGQLQDALLAGEHREGNTRQALESTREVADQLTLERPDRKKILSRLESILVSVSSSETLVGLVKLLRDTVIRALV